MMTRRNDRSVLALLSVFRRRRFTRAAYRLLHNSHLRPPGKIANDITAQDLVGYVFDRYDTRISFTDAQEYLDEARDRRLRPATEK